ncbi:MAG: choice-of-anchor B domain-containing protein [Patiriisocius sp.]|jgi:choice-of-anchor B domain-containing protein
MIKKILFASIALLCSTQFYSQIPCVDGMAGDYPCDGYDLMGHMTLSELGIPSDGNDCWGWTDPEFGNEYAIMGGVNRTVFVDITDPSNLIFVGYMPTATSNSIWRDMKVYDNHAFIVSEAGGHGMQVFDLTRLRDVSSPPDIFDEDAYYDGFGNAHNIAINEATGYAYPIGTQMFDGGPMFINIQDPLNPVLEGGFDGDGYTHDAQIIEYDGPDVEHQCQEIFFGYNANTLTIVDITDKTDPQVLSITGYENTGYTHQGWLNEDRTIVYLNDETDELNFGNNTRTIILDVSDLDNPVLLDEYFGETAAIDHNLYVNGDKVFEANYNAGMRVLQTSDDPDNRLDEIGFFDVNPNSNSAGFNGSWSLYPFFESGNIVISAIDQGLFVVASTSININHTDPMLVDCSVGVEEFLQANFGVYPNPTNGEINLTFENQLQLELITISDIVGKVVRVERPKTITNESYKMDVGSLFPGAYFLTINNETKSQKIIIE